jgi:eukaryotic-like serine/threonine-protein kinase
MAPSLSDRYRLEDPIGVGGMATVYRAHDVELDRPVAVKVLADPLASDPEIRTRFLREGRLAARLSHPNVVRVFDAGEQDGRPFIVMEHVEGETLADVLRRRGRLPPDEAVELVLQAGEGLDSAHGAGLVHRDVKPQNLLVGDEGTLKVADFGIARALEGTQVTQAGTILGTAAYLAPEQAAGESVGPAADVYGLGAVLYELLAGRPPFEDASLEALVLRHREEEVAAPPLPPAVPPEVEDVVMRALARVPAHRPASAADLAHELRSALGEAPTQRLPAERPTEVLPRRGRSAAGRRAGAIVAAALSSLALLVLALVLLPGRLEGTGDGGDAPARVEPVPQAETPEEQARNLADWIRRHSR